MVQEERKGLAMQRIELSQGHVALVDDDDYDRLSLTNWIAGETSRGKVYALATVRVSAHKRTTVYLHREIMQPPPGMFVDHINGDTLDNRRENLRICTPAENSRNRKGLHPRNTTGYIGVYRHYGKWRAQISINNRTLYLGLFTCPKEAAQARDDKARELYGKHCYLNFPDNKETI